MALQPAPFPIDQPVMPEERQIGRRTTIDRLHSRILAPAHQWILGARRIGKTSVAKAAFARLRESGAIALETDLSRGGGMADSTVLAGDLARQAQAAGAAGESMLAVSKRLVGAQSGRVAKIGEGLAVLGNEEAAEVAALVAATLGEAHEGTPSLEQVLTAIALGATAHGRRVFVLLDEVHLLAQIDAESEVAETCRRPDSPVVFVFAGSDESSARALREPGRPLTSIGEEFRLPEIAWADWLPGLRARFLESGIEIADRDIHAILEASEGHPRRTMLIASRIHAAARLMRGRVAESTLVALQIEETKGDRSWN